MKSLVPDELRVKCVCQIQPPIPGVTFSNNISIPHLT